MSFVIDLLWSKYTLISLFFMCYYFMYECIHRLKKEEKKLGRHNRWQDSNLSSGSKVRFHQVSGVSSIDWPRQKWDDGGVFLQYSLPSESPCVSTAKQLGAEDAEPFTKLWQYCNTWKQQPRSQVMMANWVESCTNLSLHKLSGSDLQNNICLSSLLDYKT